MHVNRMHISSLLLLLISAAMICSSSTSNERAQQGYNVCKSPECFERAKLVNASLDPCVDPCDDFYSYACGGWVKSHTLPEDKASLDPMAILDDDLMYTLRDIFGNVTLVPGSHQNVSDKAAVVYNACVAVPERPDTLDPVLDILNAHGLGSWPVTGRTTSNKTWADVLLKAGMSAVLSMFVEKDLQILTSHIIQIDQVHFSVVGRNQLIYPNDTQYNLDVTKAYKNLMQTVAKFVRPAISESESRELADTLLNFEGQLANLTTPPEQRGNMFALYNRVNISAVQSAFPSFPLLHLLNNKFNHVNITLTEKEVIEFYCVDYYSKLIKFLDGADSTTLFNYVGMKLLFGVAGLASKTVRESFFELDKVQLGVRHEVPRWKRCAWFVNSEMSVIAGYFYVQRKFSLQAKQEVEDLVSRLTLVFNKTLQHSKWMDNMTRAHAVEKLSKMQAKIGYQNWLLNTSYLEELGEYIPQLDPKSPFINIWLAITKNNWAKYLQLLRKPYNKTAVWAVGPTVVNAFYIPSSNEMEYPSAVLQTPIYQHGIPRSLNFGAIGMVVGHEMTHGFDAQGSQFNGDGELRYWWSNNSRAMFEQKAKCFVDQYGGICDPETGMKLNALNTVNEDIADNGGLRTAFKAYEKYLKEECGEVDTRLPGLEHLSGKQLFFIANAMVWCSLSTKEELQSKIQYDTHSPHRYRVNTPMQNMEEFSSVFKCPAGSPMNPKRNETCKLW